ncbi:MAG: cytochrome c [Pseudomonadota bacterium]
MKWTGAIALAASAVAAVALAHGGASGVVLERMKGMAAMRDTVAELAPMMQGAVPYDAFIVSEGAAVIASHAGNTMLSLFPDGSLEGVTYAKPEIWSNWQEFTTLAAEMKLYADALAEAAPNGLEPAPAPAAEMAGMAMPPAVEVARGPTVAELMGYAERAPDSPVSRGQADPGSVAPTLASLAADDLFNRISGTCSSCHAQFRTGRN